MGNAAATARAVGVSRSSASSVNVPKSKRTRMNFSPTVIAGLDPAIHHKDRLD
jgi:hypothetical protein